MFSTGLKVYQFISLALIGGAIAYEPFDYSNLNTLGDQISRHVNEQLAPLQNLGARITNNVQQQLAPLRNAQFYHNIHPNNEQHFARFQSSPYPVIPPIPPFTGPDLSGLNNLGEQIQQSVYQGLEPVRALEINNKLKNGVGGVTIATHLPQGRKFIIQNYQIYQCIEGEISMDDGKCSGSLIPFIVKEKKDYCYNRNGFSIINNHICIGGSTVSVINNDIKCLRSDGNPALILSIDEFNKLCGGVSDTVEYKYIANPSDLSHIDIPNKNKYVKCSNNQPGVCVFTESNIVRNNNGNVIINSNIHVN